MKQMKYVIVMKYGVHAKEEISSIIDRKLQEITENGYCFWGYGGTLLHPLNQVQPFCQDEKVYLLLIPTPSSYLGEAKEARYYSTNQKDYKEMPNTIHVLGSKYALVFDQLRRCDMDINLCDYEIGIGNSKGKKLNEYLNGRVDKACAIYVGGSNQEKMVHVDYIAELKKPYSVFVKNED